VRRVRVVFPRFGVFFVFFFFVGVIQAFFNLKFAICLP